MSLDTFVSEQLSASPSRLRASSAKGLPKSGRLSSSDLRKLTARTTGWCVKSLRALIKKEKECASERSFTFSCGWSENYISLYILWWVKQGPWWWVWTCLLSFLPSSLPVPSPTFAGPVHSCILRDTLGLHTGPVRVDTQTDEQNTRDEDLKK